MIAINNELEAASAPNNGTVAAAADGVPPAESTAEERRHDLDASPAAVNESAQGSGTVLGAVTAVSIDAREVGVSLVVLLLWLGLVAAGITVATQPYIDYVSKGNGLTIWGAFGALAVITVCHTATNVAMLCCLSAFLGVIGSRSITPDGRDALAGNQRMSAYVAATTRGFFVYLIMQSGAVVFAQAPFSGTTLEQYVRLAALASLISFTVGYQPGLFQSLLTRVNLLASGERRGEAAPSGSRN